MVTHCISIASYMFMLSACMLFAWLTKISQNLTVVVSNHHSTRDGISCVGLDVTNLDGRDTGPSRGWVYHICPL